MCGSGRLRYLITMLLLAAGAPLLTIAHFFRNHFLRKDDSTYFCQIFPLLSTAGTILMCFDYFEQERFNASESIVSILPPTRSTLFMIPAHDSIAMYLAIEPQSSCFYVIAASKRNSEFPTEAGSKYSILGAFPPGISLFGYDRTTTDICYSRQHYDLYYGWIFYKIIISIRYGNISQYTNRGGDKSILFYIETYVLVYTGTSRYIWVGISTQIFTLLALLALSLVKRAVYPLPLVFFSC